MQQTASLEVYLDKFEDLLNDIDEQSEGTLITFFVGGLKPELKNELKILKPTSLRQAFSAAKMFDVHPSRRHLS